VLSASALYFCAEDSFALSASIAYYSLLSVFPLLLLLLALSGLFIRRYELSGYLTVVLSNYLPMKADFVMLNQAWGVKEERSWWRRRLVALEMASIVGFLILASSILVGANIYLHAWARRRVFSSLIPLFEISYHTLLLVGTFGSTLAMFVVMLERLPNRTMRLREVLPSAFFTAMFWEAARSLFSLLLPLFNYQQIYGSIGAMVALMTWAYISAVVMLFGARVSAALYSSLSAGSADDRP